MNRCFLILALSLALGCHGAEQGPVAPAPAGPVDLVRSLWGDYSGRCPDDHQYCNASSQPICCPIGQRCEEDSGGAYCVPRSEPGVAVYDREADASPMDCLASEIMCTYMGRTTCCASNRSCCVAEDGPVCCDISPEI